MGITNFVIYVLIFTMFFVRCSDADEHENLHYYGTLEIDGFERSYLVNVPKQYQANSPIPLVVVLHGTGGQASQSERDYGWTEKSNSEKFIVVYPEGVRKEGKLKLRSWNAGRCCHHAMEQDIDDSQFIRKLIETLAAKYLIDENRVFVTGMSNGGMLAYRLACEMPDKIAAIASVSGNLITSEPCEPAQPIPLLHIHSSLDTKVPYAGGQGLGGYYFPPADSGFQIFIARNGCNGVPIVQDHGDYRFTQWQGCAENSAVETYLLSDGGHSWPGGLKPTPRSDEPSKRINATNVIWEFFKRHPRQ